jgi:hypothetical protein
MCAVLQPHLCLTTPIDCDELPPREFVVKNAPPCQSQCETIGRETESTVLPFATAAAAAMDGAGPGGTGGCGSVAHGFRIKLA